MKSYILFFFISKDVAEHANFGIADGNSVTSDDADDYNFDDDCVDRK